MAPYFCVRTIDFDRWIFNWIFKVDIHFLRTGYSLLGFSRGYIERWENTIFSKSTPDFGVSL